jgi:hypothetical protein
MLGRELRVEAERPVGRVRSRTRTPAAVNGVASRGSCDWCGPLWHQLDLPWPSTDSLYIGGAVAAIRENDLNSTSAAHRLDTVQIYRWRRSRCRGGQRWRSKRQQPPSIVDPAEVTFTRQPQRVDNALPAVSGRRGKGRNNREPSAMDCYPARRRLQTVPGVVASWLWRL